MVKVKYDVRDSDPEKAKGREGFEKPQPGVYPAKVVGIDHAFAKDERTGKDDKDRPMLVVKYEIQKNKKGFEGSWMWDRVPLNSEAAKWKLDQFLLAFGVAEMKKKRKGEFDTDDLIGEKCRIRVRGGEYKKEYSPDVAAVLPPAEDGEEDEDDDPTVDDELGGDDDADLGSAEDEDSEDVLYYDMTELASMDLGALNDVANDLDLEVPKAKAKSRVALSKWIFENQPGEPPEEEDGDGDGDGEDEDEEGPDLEALATAADDDGDEDAIETLTGLAEEAELDPDDYDTWADLVEALSEGSGGEDGGDDSDDGYEELSEKELKAELKDRGLATAGKKDALVKRLRQDDATEPF